LRFVLAGASLLLLLVTLAAWARGYWSWYRISLWRESMDDSRYWLTESRFDLGRGDMGVEYSRFVADAETARARGCPPGVRYDPWFFASEPRPVRQRNLPTTGPSRLPEYRSWRWQHAGVSLAWREWRDNLAGIWGGRIPDAQCKRYYFAFPCWMPTVVFAALPGQRVYAWLRRRRKRATNAASPTS
jgi:hypothetical protein